MVTIFAGGRYDLSKIWDMDNIKMDTKEI